MPPMSETSTYTPDEFHTGPFPIHTEPEVIAAGQGALAARTVMGRVTATGKWVKSLAAANDGSEVPRAILVEAVDATAEVTAPFYKAGEFNPDLLIYGTGHTAASVQAALEGTPLFLRRAV